MNGDAPPARRPSRETRLLIVTIAVAGLVLLLLARLRFPEPPVVVPVSTPPLERLAARASYDELATQVARLEATIAPHVIVLRLAPAREPSPSRLSDLLAAPDPAWQVRHVPALRLDATSAIAFLPPDSRISGIVGHGAAGTAGIQAADPVRRLARIRVPEGAAREVPRLALEAVRAPAYVVAAEGTQAGLTLRPVFLGRADRYQSPRWGRPVLPLGGLATTPGALVFTLAGELLGGAVPDDGTLVIVGAGELIDAAATLAATPPPVDPGIAVQPLTSALAAATGAAHGVVVAEVLDGPARGQLRPGDVITEIDGRPVADLDTLLVELGRGLAAGPVALTVRRDGEARPIVLRLEEPEAGASARTLQLQSVRGAGSRITALPPSSPLARAGAQASDVIVQIGGVDAPTPAQVRRALAGAPAGGHLLLAVRRDGRQHVMSVPMATGSDGAGR